MSESYSQEQIQFLAILDREGFVTEIPDADPTKFDPEILIMQDPVTGVYCFYIDNGAPFNVMNPTLWKLGSYYNYGVTIDNSEEEIINAANMIEPMYIEFNTDWLTMKTSIEASLMVPLVTSTIFKRKHELATSMLLESKIQYTNSNAPDMVRKIETYNQMTNLGLSWSDIRSYVENKYRN